MKNPPQVTVTFCGAAETVTGSKYLVESEGESLLVDCGLFQGEKELRLRNWDAPPFEAAKLSAIVLTHAHIDHIGYLPAVVKSGFAGPIYCTEATKDLAKLLLLDSAYLQEEEARFAEKHGTSRHSPPKPLYNQDDAKRAIELLRSFPRDTPFRLTPRMTVQASHVGHILGAAALNLTVEGSGGHRRITFSGDVGRFNAPILPDPEPIELGELLVCESTYGDTVHGEHDILGDLERIVKNTVERNGLLLVPAFAVGRTQTLLYCLAQLEREQRIPKLPVFVDSPMAVDATELYRKHTAEHDEEGQRFGANGLKTARTFFCHSPEESKRLNGLQGPRIVISASGMATGGRVLHHLKNFLPNPSTTVLLIGFQAEGTRGRTIESGASHVKIFGQYVPIEARVEKLSALSAHGDREELLRWLKSCIGTPSLVKVVHGERAVSHRFAATLKTTLGWRAEPARYLERVELG